MQAAFQHAIENVEREVAVSTKKGASEFAESIKQTVRRIRQTSNETEALGICVSSTGGYAGKAAVFLLEDQSARLLVARGLAAGHLAVELKNAAAFFAVV